MDAIQTAYIIFFVARLIFNQINKVQWVNFKLENVLVSLHSIIFKEWRVTWTFSYTEDLFVVSETRTH
jgi:hypothetical protein